MTTHIYKCLLAITFVLTACNQDPTRIEAICESVGDTGYIVKWDTDTEACGQVDIYVSNDPDQFNLRVQPVATAKISDKICLINLDKVPDTRSYFLLRFNHRQDVIVASRAPQVTHAPNLRDMGGYKNEQQRAVKWGYLLRSGHLHAIDKAEIGKFNALDIKTLIDFTDRSRYRHPDESLHIDTVHHLPIDLITTSRVFDRLHNETLRRGDANIFLQDLFISLIDSGIPAYRTMFDLLLDKKNYPVMLSDKFGKDYVGFAAALILLALDVPEETVYDDYLLSNQYLDRRSISFNCEHCSTDTQEAATALMTVRKRQLFCAIRRIKKRYGTVQQYLQKEIDLTPEKQQQLQTILLY